jgi:protocatechuate 3,4-dioxygenase beta subunit
VSRRRALALLAGAGATALAACSGSSDSSSPTSTSGATGDRPSSPDTTGPGEAFPEETAGPFPGDGSNGPDALGTDGVVRRDLRSSFGGMTGSVSGVPLVVALTVVDAARGTPLAGAAVYAWHCDADGRYSLYSDGVTNQNWLRGVQTADRAGALQFVTVFPGAYPGRYPHIHFDVFPTETEAVGGGTPITTSQLALPAAACRAAYATAGYEQSARVFPRTPLAADGIFADGWERQVARTTGDARSGFTAALTIPV